MTKIIRINSQYQEVTAQEALKLSLSGDAVLVESDPQLAYYTLVLGPWSPGEAAIASDPAWAHRYARDVIGGRWPPGEAAIASDPEWAYWYAQGVIRGPWPPGEAAISSNPEWACRYSRLVVGEPWPPGEAVMAKDPKWARAYAAYRRDATA